MNALATWHDPADPHRGERTLPRNFCLGCGHVSATVKDDLTHVAGCAERPVRSWCCWACATENWKRTECRCCGWEVR